ncbi:Bifunctional NAD(P)H-hydrate repair enzyme Nnr [Aquisphaera giovannonii]|uniref:ADP-dependent (S)-NAD(P)H-hydrate dehydratase n=1 Tax=Aquisphaera giovannonii TaxID=406548 RepID=A0A5B9W6Z9_9BACT|nr:NAD(P)H-hydrate dehydratase [Aquisphaera giovannonii]QEH35865.1 Bifunctional NAD(P)H-hydrate repair enzyme Nnr [Aquisphaera giovannonii]
MSRKAKVLDRTRLAELPLPEHGGEASKADKGKLLIVAGSASLPGAAILAARAALRVGCGTVRVASPRCVAVAIGVAVPELMVLALPETDAGTAAEDALKVLEEQYERCQAAVIGPGLGSHEETDRLAARFVAESPLPTVVDASALLAWGRAGHPGGPAARVLTPHAGEMAELAGLGPDEIEADREGLATRLARQWRSTLILKGPRTLIAGRELYANTAGTPGLGTAGSGDALAGVIGGLLARGAGPTAAAAWGVHLHALAGEAAAASRGDEGMMASDVVEALPDALRSLRGGRG